MPAMWFAPLLIFLSFSIVAFIDEGGSIELLPYIVVPILMMAFGYILMKWYVNDIIDQVYDEGSTLLFVNAKEEVRVNLKEIVNVRFHLPSLMKITISVQHDTKFGNELSFLVMPRLNRFKKNRHILELIDRIDAAKGF